MSTYIHAILAGIAAALSFVVSASTGGGITPTEWVNVAIAGIGTFFVWLTSNVPGYTYAKAVTQFAIAGLTILASVIVGGVTWTEWIQVLLAALAAVGITGATALGK